MLIIKKFLKKQRKNFKKGSTLIELLIATMIVGTVVTAVAAGVSSSVKNNSEARYREIATVLAQQGMETLRSERGNLGWITFHDSITPGTFCMPTGMSSLTELTTNQNLCIVTESNLDFNRSVVLTKQSGASPDVSAEITVSWERKSGVTSDVKVTQTFKDFTRQ
ncbi:MAG: hypothetical protein CO156_01410 [Candidatus Pacebacteria bacterium CG_4_9_14_3_um_filter_40_12]|nr:MAG: hypothetical protein COU64_00225 [Candidatus Pacebacteria bacterium CG10_big_fil_rev_8_21_14_0_10_40_26]PIZ79070.1 MAG: hypothetical protein COY01_01425 [Candidatus Pacebacteria bacterium CG_4_10_14_0_2_um_filter_40_20]PJA69242.1 MAG: hypothetical protein CO156_01410 [Candidatus Pacebacteria bacterium CG_4_9_14_3_um_filter_40_12]PJC42036.1 MAG: hypothetical protein CO041_00135 [Candidatus Pacebacteria bacterium CG_4_9_14_0_2_um_filter_40_15]